MATPVHLQYNSPMQLYSRETAEEQYNQQVGGIVDGAPIVLNSTEKHFDPSRSKVLQELQHANDADTFGYNFAEKIARAETPKIPFNQEPSWVNYAKEKTERARSRTPGHEYTPNDPLPSGQMYHHGGPQDEAREYAEKTKTFVHHADDNRYGPAYYQVQRETPRHRSHSASASRGYDMGGMDYTSGMQFENDPYASYYTRRREHSQPPPVAGTDFGTGEISYGPYHGHGPDPPRLRPRYTADSRAPLNPYIAPNIDSADPSLLVGDTLSNQKCPPKPSVHDNSFGTSFAPPSGFRPDHRTYRAPPKAAEPVTFCVSAPKNMIGRSSAPSYHTDVYRERQSANDKEVSPHTLLTDDALRPIYREHTPEWFNHSLSKHDGWKHRSDPRLDRSLEVYYTEPNWKRNVDARKDAWERRAFETEQKLNRPIEAKVPSGPPPFWTSQSDAKHNVWQNAADDVSRGGFSQSSHYKPHVGSGSHVYQNGGGHTFNQFNTQPLTLSTGHGDAVSMHSPGGYSVHSTSQSGDRNTGNYASSEHFEKEERDANRYEKRSYDQSESKSHTVNGQQVPLLSTQSTFIHPTGGMRSSDEQKYSSYNTSNQTTTTKTPLIDHRPLTSHHIANGVETDILNRGFNSNQAKYFHEKHAAPTPHHHHTPVPKTTTITTSQSSPMGHRYANISSESTGQPGGPNYSTHQSYSSEERDPSGRGYKTSSMTKSEQRTTTGGGAPISVGWTSGQNKNESSYNQQYSHESSKRTESTTQPITHTTTYSYAQQPLTVSQVPGETRYEHYTMKRREEKSEETKPVIVTPQPSQETRYEKYSMRKHEEKTEESRPIPLPQPVPINETRYGHYSSKRHEEKKEETKPIVIPAPPPVQETRYEHYSSKRHEETKTEESRPTSQASHYSEQKNYDKSSNQRTTTTSNISTAPRVVTTTSSSGDAFDRRAEMAETLPRGAISNTMNNTQGEYRDHSGQDVRYKRELSTSADPGREVALLKEEEKRIIEKPLEPGVISRHVTTKYYKKKTTTDTTTTTTPTN